MIRGEITRNSALATKILIKNGLRHSRTGQFLDGCPVGGTLSVTKWLDWGW